VIADQPFDALAMGAEARGGLEPRRLPCRFGARRSCKDTRHFVPGYADKALAQPVEAAECKAGRVDLGQRGDDSALHPGRAMGDAPGLGDERCDVDHQLAGHR
jgi:hypothetical protein